MVRARQRRPPRHKGPAPLTRVQVQRRRVAEDDPPPMFSELRDFRRPWREWSPRAEADFVRWCLMEDGTSYDDAEAELGAVTPLLRPQPPTDWQGAASVVWKPRAPNARGQAA
jgi:hypothetical protein